MGVCEYLGPIPFCILSSCVMLSAAKHLNKPMLHTLSTRFLHCVQEDTSLRRLNLYKLLYRSH